MTVRVHKLAAGFLFAEALVPLFGAVYCWRDGLLFGGFAWLTIALALIAAGVTIYRQGAA